MPSTQSFSTESPGGLFLPALIPLYSCFARSTSAILYALWLAISISDSSGADNNVLSPVFAPHHPFLGSFPLSPPPFSSLRRWQLHAKSMTAADASR
jgi:hypothetical protein